MGFTSRTSRKARRLVEWLIAAAIVALVLLGLFVVLLAFGVIQLPAPSGDPEFGIVVIGALAGAV